VPHTNTWEPGGLYRKFTGTISGEEMIGKKFECDIFNTIVDAREWVGNS